MINDSDEKLITLIQKGETKYYKEIVRRYNNRIFSIGMRFFKNEDDASDFTQDVFIRAFEKLYQYKFLSPFSHWLVRLAFNFAKNKIKSKKETLPINEFDLIEQDTNPGLAEQSEIVKLLNNAIKALPDKYKVCVDLFFFWGMKLSEISEITKMPVNTIKSHVRRSKALLKEKLTGTIAEDYHEM